MNKTISIAFLFATLLSASSWGSVQKQDLQTEFQKTITEVVLPKAQEFAATTLNSKNAADFIGSLMKFQFSFIEFTNALCTADNEVCRTTRFTEGLELAHNLALLPNVAPEQLALPTRPFQRAEEFCALAPAASKLECIKTAVKKEENLLLQTRESSLAERGVSMAQDYSRFAMHLNPSQDAEYLYFWYYDYALHYLEDRLSDY